MSGFCTGDMDLMVSQVRRSVVSVVQQYSHIRWAFPSLLINSSSGVSLLPNKLLFSVGAVRGLYLCGHSAGAHLAAMVLSTDWSQYSLNPQIKGRPTSPSVVIEFYSKPMKEEHPHSDLVLYE